MRDRWLITLEIETYDGNPAEWDWSKIIVGEDKTTIIKSEFKGRVLPTSEGENK